MKWIRHKLPLLLLPLLLGAAPAPDASAPSFVDALLDLMVRFKMSEGSPESALTDDQKRALWRPLVEMTYEQCQVYEETTHVMAETCASVAINAVYWETGLQRKYQDTPKSGPSGEECFYQLHRTAAEVPFDEWRPVHEYGTRHSDDGLERCVEDGVRVFSYHLWRCHLDERDLRTDTISKLWKLYSEYYLPTPTCWHLSTKRPVLNRAYMARRILRRLPAEKFRAQGN